MALNGNARRVNAFDRYRGSTGAATGFWIDVRPGATIDFLGVDTFPFEESQTPTVRVVNIRFALWGCS